MRHYSQRVDQWCRDAKIISILTIENIDHAIPVVNALYRGGIKLVEITLRTPVALEAIARVRHELPNVLVAAGTVRTVDDVYAAKSAGAHLVVSPGTTKALLDASFDAMLPIIPGVASASEAMQWSEYGLHVFKFFPAEHCGGVGALRAMSAPLPDLFFCPTGGITPERAKEYLALPNVLCIGGSWFATREHYQNERWDEVEALARDAM